MTQREWWFLTFSPLKRVQISLLKSNTPASFSKGTALFASQGSPALWTSSTWQSRDFFSERGASTRCPAPYSRSSPGSQISELSPQPQAPWMLGLLNADSADNLSSTQSILFLEVSAVLSFPWTLWPHLERLHQNPLSSSYILEYKKGCCRPWFRHRLSHLHDRAYL